MRIIAHRGASHTAPENTLEAIEAAWREGADGVEIDVRMTRDGHVVVAHDETLERVAGLPGRINELDWDTLCRVDVGLWKGDAWRHARVPSLEAVLRQCSGRGSLYIEIKDGLEIMDPLSRVVASVSPDPARIHFLAFSADVLTEARRRFAASACYWNVSFAPDAYGPGWSAARESIERIVRVKGWTGIGWECAGGDETAALMRERDRALDAYVWTVDEAESARALAEAGCPALITNRPGWLRKQLQG